MSSLPAIRNRSTLKKAAILALSTGAVLAAVAPGLSTLVAQMNTVVASAELATGAALQGQNGWLLPAVFSVSVFTLVVGGAVALTRIPAARSGVPILSRTGGRPAPVTFELREPERALSVRIDRLPG